MSRITLNLSPSPIIWKSDMRHDLQECFVGDMLVGWLTPRPPYCDRGHWQVDVNLPDIDGADGFPRYYMSRKVAIAETQAWLRWRLWKITPGTE